MKIKYRNVEIELYLITLHVMGFLRCINRMFIIEDNFMLSQTIDVLENSIYIILLFLFFKNKHTVKELITIGFLIIVGLIVTFTAHEALFLTIFLVVGARRNEEIEDIFHSIFSGMFLGTIIVIVLYFSGFSASGEFRREAVSLGFSHPNVCGYTLTQLVLLKAAFTKTKFKEDFWILYIVAIILNIVFTKSRTSILILLTFPILRVIIKKNNKLVNRIIIAMPIILMIFTLYTAINFERSGFWLILDSFMNGRLTLNNYNFYKLGVPLLGQQVVIYKDYILVNTIDCAYMALLLGSGILGSVVFLGSYILSLDRMIKDNKSNLLTCASLLLLSGLMENSLLDIVAGFPLIYFSNVYRDFINGNIKYRKEDRKNDSKNNSLLLVWRK